MWPANALKSCMRNIIRAGNALLHRLSTCPQLLWSILWISRDKLRQVNDLQGKSSLDENQGSIPLLFINLGAFLSATVKVLKEGIMESFRTVSYILLVVATVAATWFVSSL